jgi:hypothetical protein
LENINAWEEQQQHELQVGRRQKMMNEKIARINCSALIQDIQNTSKVMQYQI